MERKIELNEIIGNVQQARLNMFRAKENSDSMLKVYNDGIDGLIQVIQLCNQKITEIQTENVKLKEELSTTGKK